MTSATSRPHTIPHVDFAVSPLDPRDVYGVKHSNSFETLAERVRSRPKIPAVTRKRADLAAQLINIAESYGAPFQIFAGLTTVTGLSSVNKVLVCSGV